MTLNKFLKHFILVGRIAVPTSFTEWGRWLEAHNEERQIGFDELPDARVSTVFLGLNHSYDDSKLEIFETMVFPKEKDDYRDIYCERYATYDEAEEGHKRIVTMLREGRNLYVVRKVNNENR